MHDSSKPLPCNGASMHATPLSWAFLPACTNAQLTTRVHVCSLCAEQTQICQRAGCKKVNEHASRHAWMHAHTALHACTLVLRRDLVWAKICLQTPVPTHLAWRPFTRLNSQILDLCWAKSCLQTTGTDPAGETTEHTSYQAEFAIPGLIGRAGTTGTQAVQVCMQN